MKNTPPPDDTIPVGSIEIPDGLILELYRCAVAAGFVARGTIAPEFAKTVFETADALMDERMRRDETGVLP